MQLSDHFSLEELTFSQTAVRRGYDNTPGRYEAANLAFLAHELEYVRRALANKPMRITSGYRSPTLNRAVGGSWRSQHMLGLAADFVCPAFGAPLEICDVIALSPHVHFDQLIHEGTWVHVSFSMRPRRDVLTAIFNNGRASYVRGLVNG